MGSCSLEQFETALSILGSEQDATRACTSFNVSTLGVAGAALAVTIQRVRHDSRDCDLLWYSITAIPRADAQLNSTQILLNATRALLDVTSEALVQTSFGLNTTFVLFGAFSVFVMQACDPTYDLHVLGPLTCDSAM